MRCGVRGRAQPLGRRAVWGVLAVLVLACYADPGYRGLPSAAWVAQLAHGGTLNDRVEAAVALGHVLELQPNDREAVAALVGALADTSDALRVSAAHALTGAARGGRRTRAALPDAVPRLVTLLGDTAHAEVRADAARVLGALGAASVAGGGTSALGRAVRDARSEVRGTALDALGTLGPAARVAWPALDTALIGAAERDPAPGNRRTALAALGGAGVPTTLYLPTLVRAAADTDAGVREVAVRTLGLLGATTDVGARAALTRALADPEAGVRQEARHALTALHRRGGEDPPPPEPSPIARCAGGGYRRPGC